MQRRPHQLNNKKTQEKHSSSAPGLAVGPRTLGPWPSAIEQLHYDSVAHALLLLLLLAAAVVVVVVAASRSHTGLCCCQCAA
jgi:hypothetical protein